MSSRDSSLDIINLPFEYSATSIHNHAYYPNSTCNILNLRTTLRYSYIYNLSGWGQQSADGVDVFNRAVLAATSFKQSRNGRTVSSNSRRAVLTCIPYRYLIGGEKPSWMTR